MSRKFIVYNRTSQTAEDIYGRTQLDHDTTQHFPWLFYTVGSELGWQWWAVHLLEEWEQLPHYLAAPSEYDENYHQLKGGQRTAWLAALRRVCNGVFMGAVLPDFDEDDEFYPLSSSLREDYGGLKEDLNKAIMRGLKKLDEWLSWREQPVATQLLTALSVVRLGTKEGVAVLPDTTQALEDKRFKAVIEEFQQRLAAEPPAESWLRTLHNQLAALGGLTLSAATVSIEELPAMLPAVQWLNLSEVLALPVSSGFWLDLKTTLATRVEWANKAASIVGYALGISALPTQNPGAPLIELSMKQGAMLYYYTRQPLTENNRSKLAAELGYTGKTSGISLMEKYVEWRDLLASELPESKRQLGHLKKDLVKVLPYLNDRSANEVVRLLNKIAKKYKGGL